MEIFQIAAVGLAAAVLAVMLKKYHPELAMLISVAAGIVILFGAISQLQQVLLFFQEIVRRSGIEPQFFSIILKTIGIAYVSEFAMEVCKDAGENGIAAKVELAGKVLILAAASPVMLRLMDTVNLLLEKG